MLGTILVLPWSPPKIMSLSRTTCGTIHALDLLNKLSYMCGQPVYGLGIQQT